jgi:hypothetical protein
MDPHGHAGHSIRFAEDPHGNGAHTDDITVSHDLTWPSNNPSTVVLGPTSGILGEGWRAGGTIIGWHDEALTSKQATYIAIISANYTEIDLSSDITGVSYLELYSSSETVNTRLVTFDDTDGTNKVGIEFDGSGDFPTIMLFRGDFSSNAEIGRVVSNTDTANVSDYNRNVPGSDLVRLVGQGLTIDASPIFIDGSYLEADIGPSGDRNTGAPASVNAAGTDTNGVSQDLSLTTFSNGSVDLEAQHDDLQTGSIVFNPSGNDPQVSGESIQFQIGPWQNDDEQLIATISREGLRIEADRELIVEGGTRHTGTVTFDSNARADGTMLGTINDGQIQQARGGSLDVFSGGTGMQMFLDGPNNESWFLRQYDGSNTERGRIRINNHNNERLALVKYDSGGNTAVDFEMRDDKTVLFEFLDRMTIDAAVDIGEPGYVSGSRGDGETLRLTGSTTDFVQHVQGGQGRIGIAWNAYWDNANSTWRSLVANEAHTLVGVQNANPGPGTDQAGSFTIHTSSGNASAGDPISWLDRFEVNGTDGDVKIHNANLQVYDGSAEFYQGLEAHGNQIARFHGNVLADGSVIGSVNDGQIQQTAGNSFGVQSGGTGIQMYLFDTNSRSWTLRQYDDSNVERGRINIDNDSTRGMSFVKFDGNGNRVADFEMRESGTILFEFQNELKIESVVLGYQFENSGNYRTASDPDFRHNFDSSNDTSGSGLFREYNNSSCDVSWDGTLMYVNSEYDHRPHTDGTLNSGNSNYRWEGVWAQDGTINTSDKKEKTNIQQIQKTAATDRVRNAADSAIQFTWANGRRGRQHAGFDADQLATAVGDNHAAYVDPSIRANEVHVPEGATGPGNGSKGLRSHELIPDLYAALADALDRIEQLESA